MPDDESYAEKQSKEGVLDLLGMCTLLLGGREGLCLPEKVAYELRPDSGERGGHVDTSGTGSTWKEQRQHS